jgi:hypothetical protein
MVMIMPATLTLIRIPMIIPMPSATFTRTSRTNSPGRVLSLSE